MAVERIFCGWDKPAIENFIGYIAAALTNGSKLDLSRALFVFPGARAGRRFLERLTVYCAENGILFIPPAILTSGALPERFYIPPKPLASALESQLAWCSAMAGYNREDLKQICGFLDDDHSGLGWMPASRMISEIYLELSAALLDFSDVAVVVESSYDSSPERWLLLRDLKQSYLEALDRCGLSDREECRRTALGEAALKSGENIFLCGLSDLSPMLRAFLAGTEDNVRCLIQAPAEESDGFDNFGTLIPQYWQERILNIPLGSVSLAADVQGEGMAALRTLDQLSAKYTMEEIAVAYTHQSLLPELESSFESLGLSLHNPTGKAMSDFRVAMLLRALSRYLADGSSMAFYELLRFPEIADLIADEAGAALVPAECDVFHERHLSATIHHLPEDPAPAVRRMQQYRDNLERLIGGLRMPVSSVGDWLSRMATFLDSILGDKEGRQAEWEAIRSAMSQLQEAESRLLPKTEGAILLNLFLTVLAEQMVEGERKADQIDAIGWLEAFMNDTPALIICGMNEKLIPESVNSDLFLPETLRAHLGLRDNQARYARDAYILASLQASVRDLSFTYSRRDAEGELMLPSRLLLSCKDNDLVRRVEQLYLEQPPLFSFSRTGSDNVPKWSVPPPPAVLDQVPDSLPVTAFKAYLECPYRFYLSYILKLETKDDQIYEMDSREFGTIGHAVIARFLEQEKSSDRGWEACEAELEMILEEQFGRQFGTRPLPAVLIQREQLRRRLHSYAEWHKAWRAEGWVTREIEYSPEREAKSFEVDGQEFVIEGRIDRIDYHPGEKKWAVFDLKFRDSAIDAEKAHISGDQWIDLQLPLYYHILRKQGISGEIRLGYINLSPEAESEKIFSEAVWSESELDTALAQAFEIIRKVRKQLFFPPARKLSYTDRFSLLTGQGQFIEESYDEYF